VYLHIDVQKEQTNMSAWEKLYKPKGNGTPMVFVISSDGRELHNESGSVGLNDLKTLLAKSGKILGEQILAKIKAAVDSAQKSLEAGQPAKAIATINPVLGTGGAGEAVQEAEAFGKKLLEDAQAKLKAAEENLAAEDKALDAAIEITQISREYAKFRPLAEDIKKLRTKQNHKDFRTFFEQARLLDQAALKAANKQNKDSIAFYQQVATKWPDTAASKLAEEKIAELGGSAEAKTAARPVSGKTASGKTASGKTATGKTAATGKPAVTGKPHVTKAQAEANERKAKGLLDVAETLADINLPEAKKNAKQVVELVPGTEMAKRAELILKRL
jgi:hypothetical protein